MRGTETPLNRTLTYNARAPMWRAETSARVVLQIILAQSPRCFEDRPMFYDIKA